MLRRATWRVLACAAPVHFIWLRRASTMAFFAAAALTPSVAAMVRPPPAPSVRPRGWGVSDVAAHAAATSVGPRHVAAARQVAPRRASSSSSPATRRSVVRRAEGADEDAPAAPDEERPRQTEEDDEEVKGAQMTAIVTGA